MRVGRWAPDPHLGALWIVEGPIMFWTCVGKGDPRGVSQTNSIPPLWVVARCRIRWLICESVAWADYPCPLCVRGRWWASMVGLVMMRYAPAGKACVNRTGVMVLASMGRRVSHPSIASRLRRRGCRLCSRASL